MDSETKIAIIGAGLAGSEAANICARRGFMVDLFEMRGGAENISTAAHVTSGCAELVCSNSFRSDNDSENAVGQLHHELRAAGSLIMHAADATKVPAGGALAVDRERFSDAVSKEIQDNPHIRLIREEVQDFDRLKPYDAVIIATGPLTSDRLVVQIQTMTGQDGLAFFDSIAPIVYRDSIDMTKAWFQSRYDKEGPGGERNAYINCPMSEPQYNAFVSALNNAPKTEFKDWEANTPYFESCLPIEVMAQRGPETLRYGPMKPVGLTNPHAPDEKPYGVVQLRQDNKEASLYNMVGFQTKMLYSAQKEIFRSILGLEKAEFARLGGIHRNSFINSPALLDRNLSLTSNPQFFFAGQITGVEGYVESTAMGLLAGLFACDFVSNRQERYPSQETAMGALLHYITSGYSPSKKSSFQPMNVNFGLFANYDDPVIDPTTNKRAKGKVKGRLKKQALTTRAKQHFQKWVDEVGINGDV